MAIKPIIFNSDDVRRLDANLKKEIRIPIDSQDPKDAPPYEVGDILWVKEAWLPHENHFHYRTNDMWNHKPPLKDWERPSAMPKSAAYYFLRVLEIYSQPIETLCNFEAMQEGFKGIRCDCYSCANPKGCPECGGTTWLIEPWEEFQEYWDARVLEDKHPEWGLEYDPWVWVIEFERCEKPDDWP